MADVHAILGQAIADGAGPVAHLVRELGLGHDLATRIWCLFLHRLPDLAGHVGEHGDLLGAIVDGDADRAAELAAAHVARFEQAIRAAL